MPLTSEDSLNLVLALSRRVKTQAGVKLYNQPVGSIINPDDVANKNDVSGIPVRGTPVNHVENNGDQGRAPSLVRIKSLLSQMKHAVKIGDESQAELLKKQLSDAITLYAKGKDMKTVMAKLEGVEP